MSSHRSGDASTRKTLAVWIIAVSILSIAGLSTVAMLTATDPAETSKLVFSSVLPLLGTWVGTVLAFYFARENLQAATDSTLAIAGIERSTPVTRFMIPESDFVAYDVGTDERVEDVALAAIHARMSEMAPPARRLPIRGASGEVLFVIHDSTLTAYAESQGETSTTLTATIGDLVAVPAFNALVNAIGFVPEIASLADSRRVMGSIENCNDVFVTSTGKRTERAIGWLTNTLLAGVQ